MASPSSPDVMLDIVAEHLEELDSLWELREGVIFAPDWTLANLAQLEERAEAHLDGLRIAGRHAVALARPLLEGEDTSGGGGVFAAAAATMVFLEAGEQDLVDEILEAFRAAAPEVLDGMRIGMRHSRVAGVSDGLRACMEDGSPLVRAAAADVMAFHRREGPPAARRLLEEPDSTVWRWALGAWARWDIRARSSGKRVLQEQHLERGLAAEDPALRRSALRACAHAGLPRLLDICRERIASRGAALPECVHFLGVIGEPDDLRHLEAALGTPSLATAALAGMGALGVAEAVPVLIECTQDPGLSFAAGTALLRILGGEWSDIQEQTAPGSNDERAQEPASRQNDERPDGSAPEPGEETDREFEEEMPRADSRRARALWERHRALMKQGSRWQGGREMPPASSVDTFDVLGLDARRDAYLRAWARDGERIADRELEARARLQAAHG
ncbi:MAG: hypothetical protein V1774_03195 [Candidatus Eisenbacteria bacterium]